MQKLILTVDAETLKIISFALGEMPTKIAMPVVLEINRQIAEQQKPTAVEDTKAA